MHNSIIIVTIIIMFLYITMIFKAKKLLPSNSPEVHDTIVTQNMGIKHDQTVVPAHEHYMHFKYRY